MALDASKIKLNTFSQLIDFSCNHKFGIHIMTRNLEAKNITLGLYQEAKDCCFGRTSDSICAPFDIDLDIPDIKISHPNRVERIAILRDHQREKLRSLFKLRNFVPEVVILADLDVWSLPKSENILAKSRSIINGKDHDVICAAGLMHVPFVYYDILATVLMQNTFVYPLSGRIIKHPMSDEDQRLIRSQELYGKVTQEGLFSHLKKERQESSSGTVQV